MEFRKINNIAGWTVFGIATLVYLLTIEQTASYWDCGEFIAVSYRLMVPHPPGAPFFLLVGRIFSFLAFGNVESVAFWINIVSILSSSFTILFLFWTISMLIRKTLGIKADDTISDAQTWKIIGASLVGSLAYTFSDSFWFSAVEAEVYAMSSFFTAIVVWAMLKWDLIEDKSRANRWLIFIAYMMGLSIGVHLLNLVTIPALGLIYYFKKYSPSTKGILFTLIISGLIVILINDLIIPGLPSIAGSFELLFVNTLGLPFGSGAVFFAIIVIAAMVFGIRYSQQHSKPLLNTAMLSLAFILIGYSSYSIIVIRSNYNPPIDENNPENVMTFVKYLKREQYGSRPLLYGRYYTADLLRDASGRPVYEEGEANYRKGEDKYIEVDRKITYKYDPKQSTLLPRMYSDDPNHVQKYLSVTGLRPNEKPTFIDNLHFMFSHQIGHMYLRYFMWNFAGRESDIQDAGWLGPVEAMKDVPQELAENKGRNNYFMIPLLFGIIGLVFQLQKDVRNFAFVGLLFILTGVALVLYLNSPPIEPRERDYIYVGSYYAFAVWIGFAVLAFAEVLGKFLSARVAAIAATLIGLAAPAIMAQQNWDDHDRSNRYFSVDSAKNFLASTAENAILFTGGDNDTFPLWYVQDVEEFRTDARVVVLSYFNTDWYIEQMMRKVYESEPFPFTLTLENYRSGGPNDYLPFEDMNINSLDIRVYIDLLKNNDKRLRAYPQANIVPSRNFTLAVDKEKVKSLGIIPEGMDSLIVDRMTFSLKPGRNGLEKKDLAILDILATNDWSRPIYLNNTSREQISFDLSQYAIQEGNAFRILPIRNPNQQEAFVSSEVMYKNLIENFHYRELDNPNVYYTEDYRNFVLNHRGSFNNLAAALIDEGKLDMARAALTFSLEKMPDEAIPYDYTTPRTVGLLFILGENEKAREIGEVVGDRSIEMVDYLIRENKPLGYELQSNLIILGELQRTMLMNGEEDLAKKYEEAYQEAVGTYQRLRGNF
ncbi:DUF2723 domain-containing protein [Fulvivirga sedimenti]|uniref:DUF2723 domain-containing protein n=1 Tax=Fulvivirga sedimenti TaxID=2879465 RepID=A0A9X1HVH4_9BACT|nr:DUF2723 domain-containing protein [Fulvivirga sedimenti]MCA6078115.1 DUF2723 domain-containing protein [Fulvivirga sedimenti]